MTQDKGKKTGIVIAPNRLSSQALEALIDEFILREGTDYGVREIDLQTKREQVARQIERQQIVILFDPALETTTLLTTEQFKRLNSQNFEILAER